MNQQNDLQEFECSICLCILRIPCTTQCGHTFCHQCISESLAQVPKCPVCRFPLLQNNLYLKENFLIKELISKKYPNGVPHPNQESQLPKPIATHNDSEDKQIPITVLLQLQSKILNCGRSKATLAIKMLQDIPFDILKQFLNTAQVVFINEQNIIESSEIYGVLATVQNIFLQNNKIQLDIMGHDRVMVNSIKKCSFKVNQEQQEPLQKEINFDMLTCKGIILQDAQVNITNPETADQLNTMLINLIEFTRIATNSNSLEHDASSLILHSALERSGLLKFLNPDALLNNQQISKFTLTLGSVLKLSIGEKQRILQTTDLIERMIILDKSIQRFKGIQNQLMIFDLDLPTFGSNSFSNNIMILIGILLALYLATISNV